MKNWIGKALIFIGSIHVIFGIVMFYPQWTLWIRQGLWNTVHGQADSEWAFWFIAIGFLAILLGALTNWIETKVQQLPRFFGWGLLTCSFVGVVLMPISGIWLIFLTSVGAIWQQAKV